MFKRLLSLLVLGTVISAAAPTMSLAQDHDSAHSPEHVADRVGAAAAPQDADDVHAHAGGHEKAPLVPQTGDEMASALPTAIWTIVIFLIMLAILYPTAWKNVLAGLKAREDRIRKDIAEAEAARARAEATLKEYNTRLATAENQVRDLLAKATADAERTATTIRMQAQQEAEEAKERAMRDIEQARKDAIREVHEQTAILATSVAEKILRRNLNPDDQRDLVQNSLDQLETVR